MSNNSDASASSPTPAPDNSNQELDRSSLVEKARAFLLSPAVRDEDDAAKRRFLGEKGLTGDEIDMLIQELLRQPPPVPPRTYPQPPPSNLPAHLASLFRVFTWITGISGMLLVGYYRFLLPRLSRSLEARHRLKLHQSELLDRLQGRLDELKETQSDAYGGLPQRGHEPIPEDIKGLADLRVYSNGEPAHTLGVVVRCAFLGEPEQKLPLDALYRRLLTHFPALNRQNEMEFKHFILRELSGSTAFRKTQQDDLEYWSFHSDVDSNSFSRPPNPTSSTQPLMNLRDAVSGARRGIGLFQHTFKSLTDFTAFLSRETFAMYGTGMVFRHGVHGGHPLSPEEEDVRRDIRALKGLVLNRRSFAPGLYRQPSAPTA